MVFLFKQVMFECYLSHCLSILFYFQYTIASCGMMEDDVEKLKLILEACPAVPAICLDVANGYSEYFVEFVKKVRAEFPGHIIMVSKL